MQPTSLNKIVSLFLSGSLLLLGIAYVLLEHAPTKLSAELRKLPATGGDGFFAVVGALLLLPLIALAGAVCESLTDICIRRFIKWIAPGAFWNAILFQRNLKKTHDFWLVPFLTAAKESNFLAGLPVDENPHGVAVGLLYDNRQEEAVIWAESHYSTYILVSSFAFLALTGEFYLVWRLSFNVLAWSQFLWATLVVGLVFYSCLSLALDRYSYSYQVALRQAVISLLKQKKAPPTQEDKETRNSDACAKL